MDCRDHEGQWELLSRHATASHGRDDGDVSVPRETAIALLKTLGKEMIRAE